MCGLKSGICSSTPSDIALMQQTGIPRICANRTIAADSMSTIDPVYVSASRRFSACCATRAVLTRTSLRSPPARSNRSPVCASTTVEATYAPPSAREFVRAPAQPTDSTISRLPSDSASTNARRAASAPMPAQTAIHTSCPLPPIHLEASFSFVATRLQPVLTNCLSSPGSAAIIAIFKREFPCTPERTHALQTTQSPPAAQDTPASP